MVSLILMGMKKNQAGVILHSEVYIMFIYIEFTYLLNKDQPILFINIGKFLEISL